MVLSVAIQSKRRTTDKPAGCASAHKFSFFSQSGVFVNPALTAWSGWAEICVRHFALPPLPSRIEERPIDRIRASVNLDDAKKGYWLPSFDYKLGNLEQSWQTWREKPCAPARPRPYRHSRAALLPEHCFINISVDN
jgi:hypothetical protein